MGTLCYRLRSLTKSGSPSERAYAIYLCGTKLGDKGADLINKGKNVWRSLTMQECVALSLVEQIEQNKPLADFRSGNSTRRTLFNLALKISDPSGSWSDLYELNRATEGPASILRESLHKFRQTNAVNLVGKPDGPGHTTNKKDKRGS